MVNLLIDDDTWHLQLSEHLIPLLSLVVWSILNHYRRVNRSNKEFAIYDLTNTNARCE